MIASAAERGSAEALLVAWGWAAIIASRATRGCGAVLRRDRVRCQRPRAVMPMIRDGHISEARHHAPLVIEGLGVEVAPMPPPLLSYLPRSWRYSGTETKKA